MVVCGASFVSSQKEGQLLLESIRSKGAMLTLGILVAIAITYTFEKEPIKPEP